MDNKELVQELQQIRVELQSNNKALQSMVAGLMELLSKLQPTLQTGLTEHQVARMLKNDRMEREAIVFRNFLSTIPVQIFCNEAGEITSIVMKEEPK